MSETLYGNRAVAQVEKDIGRPLTRGELRVVMEEGYVKSVYDDTKGLKTQGVGQTGDYIGQPFDEVFKAHVDRARRKITNFDDYPEYLRDELIQSEYRGDIGQSPTAMRYLREGKYDEAATEFLNHKEYNNPKTPTAIKARLEATSNAIRKYGREQKVAMQTRNTHQLES